MAENLYFRRQALETLLSGKSVLDAQKLSVRDLGQAAEFIKTYGYDFDDEKDRRIIDSYYRQAVAFLQDMFADDSEELPPQIFDANTLEDIRNVFVYASRRKGGKEHLQKWACATLKVMHSLSHLNNDFYSLFQDDIRSQILSPIKDCFYKDDIKGASFLQSDNLDEKIKLHKFEVKPVKNQNSSVIKLLAKRRLVALNILDRVGVRFVTRNTFDVFQVIRFLVNNSLVSYPHCIVNESANMVYPTNLFLEAMDGLRSVSPMAEEKEIEEILAKKLVDVGDDAEFKEKGNIFTASNYRFVKFISRKLINVDVERSGKTERVKFFYPFEVQIMDYETHLTNMRGPLSHDEYKKRQVKAARLRLFGLNDIPDKTELLN